MDIIIATPGVLLRLLRQGLNSFLIVYSYISCPDLDEHFGIERRLIGANLRHIIVDEADTLLDITFSPAVTEIIRRLEARIEVILFKHLTFKSRLMFNQSMILNIMLRPLFNLFSFRLQYLQQPKRVSKN